MSISSNASGPSTLRRAGEGETDLVVLLNAADERVDEVAEECKHADGDNFRNANWTHRSSLCLGGRRVKRTAESALFLLLPRCDLLDLDEDLRSAGSDL